MTLAVKTPKIKTTTCTSVQKSLTPRLPITVTHPEIAAEWDWEANDKNPLEVSAGSRYKAWWNCSKNHKWQAVVSSRANGRGCAKCSGRQIERMIFEGLLTRGYEAISQYKVTDTDYEDYSYIKVDIYLPGSNTVFEYDRVYWHSMLGIPERDHRKTVAMVQKYNVVRAREISRKQVLPHLDIISDNLIQIPYKHSLKVEDVAELLDLIEEAFATLSSSAH